MQNRNMDAKAYLQQAQLYAMQISTKAQEIKHLRELTTKVTASLSDENIGHSGNTDKLGSAVARMVDLQKEISDDVEAYTTWQSEITQKLKQIKNPTHLAVLQKRYMLCESFEKIASDLGYTYRNVCYIHGSALQAFSEILKEEQPPCM